MSECWWLVRRDPQFHLFHPQVFWQEGHCGRHLNFCQERWTLAPVTSHLCPAQPHQPATVHCSRGLHQHTGKTVTAHQNYCLLSPSNQSQLLTVCTRSYLFPGSVCLCQWKPLSIAHDEWQDFPFWARKQCLHLPWCSSGCPDMWSATH